MDSITTLTTGGFQVVDQLDNMISLSDHTVKSRVYNRGVLLKLTIDTHFAGQASIECATAPMRGISGGQWVERISFILTTNKQTRAS